MSKKDTFITVCVCLEMALKLKLDIKRVLRFVVDVKDAASSEELVLNTVATLNNLSFYNDSGSVVQQRQVEITESKCATEGQHQQHLLESKHNLGIRLHLLRLYVNLSLLLLRFSQILIWCWVYCLVTIKHY